ncbi:MAG: cation transporter [Fluviicola sp.]|nr:cation transporter [Fluviicola sp.]
MKKITLIFSILGLTLISLNSCSTTETKEKIPATKTVVENGIATSTFKVWGNCDMCKETIENSLKVEGVQKADWNSDTKLMKISYETSKISLDQIEKNIASVGYDNVKYKGDDEAYSALHECCQYERK